MKSKFKEWANFIGVIMMFAGLCLVDWEPPLSLGEGLIFFGYSLTIIQYMIRD